MTDDAAMQRMRMATIQHRVPHIIRATMRNLHRIGDKGAAPLAGRPLEGCTAIICGAGPSLAGSGAELKRLQSDGAVLFAVNTAAPWLYDHGIRPDYLVCIESLPRHEQIDKDAVGWVVSDMSSHPQAFDMGDMWLLNPSPHNLTLLHVLGVPPVWGGGAAVNTAFSLAVDWGATQLVLVGCDLAYDVESGKAYADGSGWAGLRVERSGDRLIFDGRKDRDELHQSNGVPMVPRNRDGIELPRWGGEGTAWTTLELEAQRRWFEGYATQLGGRRLVNASVGGASIGGFEERLLSSVTAEGAAQEPTLVYVDPEPAVARLRLEAARVERLVREWMDPSPSWDALTDLADGCLFVDGMASGDFAGLQQHQMTPPARMRAIYTVLGRAADEVAKGMGVAE